MSRRGWMHLFFRVPAVSLVRWKGKKGKTDGQGTFFFLFFFFCVKLGYVMCGMVLIRCCFFFVFFWAGVGWGEDEVRSICIISISSNKIVDEGWYHSTRKIVFLFSLRQEEESVGCKAWREEGAVVVGDQVWRENWVYFGCRSYYFLPCRRWGGVKKRRGESQVKWKGDSDEKV